MTYWQRGLFIAVLGLNFKNQQPGDSCQDTADHQGAVRNTMSTSGMQQPGIAKSLIIPIHYMTHPQK